MKTVKYIGAVLLCAVMLFSLAACTNKESVALVGTWETEFDISEYLNAAIDEEMGDYAQFFRADELPMTLKVRYSEDETYEMWVDTDAFVKECEKLIPAYTDGYRKAYEYIAAQSGTSVEALLGEAGKTFDEMAGEFVSSLDPEAMAEALHMKGLYRAQGGKLYRSNSLDERVDKERYETYELTGDGVITVTGYVGDDADSNPFVYPMTFKRK